MEGVSRRHHHDTNTGGTHKQPHSLCGQKLLQTSKQLHARVWAVRGEQVIHLCCQSRAGICLCGASVGGTLGGTQQRPKLCVRRVGQQGLCLQPHTHAHAHGDEKLSASHQATLTRHSEPWPRIRWGAAHSLACGSSWQPPVWGAWHAIPAVAVAAAVAVAVAVLTSGVTPCSAAHPPQCGCELAGGGAPLALSLLESCFHWSAAPPQDWLDALFALLHYDQQPCLCQ